MEESHFIPEATSDDPVPDYGPEQDDEQEEYPPIQRCTWHRFSRAGTRQLMPPNIPRTKITDADGREMECPLVPELKLTTPEGEDFWLDDLTYHEITGGWADSDDDLYD